MVSTVYMFAEPAWDIYKYYHDNGKMVANIHSENMLKKTYESNEPQQMYKP